MPVEASAGNRRAAKFVRGALLAIALLVPSVAFAAIGVNKTFNPANVSIGQSSTLTVILINNNPSTATGATFTDGLPGTVVVATPANASNTCGGAVTATPGANNFSFAGGTIPAAVGVTAGTCTVQVDVVSPVAGVFINTLPANAVTSSQGNNSQAASATLTVAALVAITGSKTFLPTNLHGNGNPSTVTIQLNNPNGVSLTGTAFTDPLPAGLIVAPTPNASTTCLPNGVVTAVAGAASASLATGTIPAAVAGVAGSCTIKFDVVASAPNTFVNGTVTNTIPAGAVTTTPALPASPAIARGVTLQTAASMAKAFAPTPITTGGTSTLTITINNFNASAISPLNFTDTLPGAGANAVVVAPVPNVTMSASCNAPAVTAVAGSNTITVTGGSLAGVAVNAGVTNTSCTITVNVVGTSTSVNPQTFTNTIIAGSFGGVNHGAASGNLVVNAPTNITATKAFVPNAVVQGGTSTLTVTINNSNAAIATLTAVFTDSLASMGAGYAVAASPAATTTCGGVLTALAGSTSFSLPVGTTIPAAGACTITVPIQVAANAVTGARTNTIAQNVLVTDRGRTQSAITAVLTTTAALTVTKAYVPLTVQAGTDSRLTVTLTHANGAPAFSGMAFTDTLPAGHTVSATPNPVTTCVGGTVTAVSGAGSFSLAGGTLAAGATTCTVAVNITSPASAGAVANSIPIGGVTTAEGFVNPAAATSTLTRVVTNVTLNKSFSPATVLVGGVSTLTINVLNTNANALALTTTGLVDTLPIGLAVAAAPLPSNTCGGALTAVAGAGTITLTGGSLAANATCTIKVNVVANASGNLINTLGAGLFTSAQGVTNPLAASATLAATGSADMQVTKTDGVVSVVPGTSTTYTIVAKNNGPQPVAGAGVVDNPPAGMTFTSWTCVASAGSACGNASGSGPISELVVLLLNGTATYTVTAAINANATGSITNTATVVVPGTVIDPNLANNTASDTDTLTPQADLVISKTDGVASVNAGGATTYTIVVSNAGPSSANGAIFKDPAVANLNVTAVACASPTGGAACPTVPNTTIALMQGAGIIVPTLPAGGSVTFTVNASVPSGASGSISNVATVTAPAGVTDPTPGNNTATDTDTITLSADLAIAKSDGVASVAPGSSTNYTIIVSNNGPSNVVGAVVADVLPASVTSDTFTAVGSGGASGFTAAGSGNINDVVNLPAGATVTYTLHANISASATGTLVNTATVTPPGGVTDPTPGNNSSTDTDTLTPQADLAITKTDGVASVNAGGTTTYTIVVSNAGPSDANGAIFKDAAVANLNVTAVTCASPTGGAACPTVPNTTVALLQGSGIVVPTLPSGGAVTFTVNATVSSGASGSISNVATVTAPAGVTDPTPGNNTATDTDTITLSADLAISKTDGVASVNAGGTTTYTIVVSNAGPSDANGAIFKDAAVANLNVTAVTCGSATGGAACPTVPNTTIALMQGSGIVVPTLPSGGAVTFTVSATVSSAASGSISNVATVTAPAGVTDATPGNNTATDTDTITLSADLAISKTDGVASVNAGGTTTYTIVVSNAGPSDANGAIFKDSAVANLTITGVTCGSAAGGAACPTVPNTTIALMQGSGIVVPTLPSGGAVTFTVNATVSSAASGSISNVATVTAPAGVTDPTPGNNTATDTDTITLSADLAISKTDGVASVNAGGTTTYTIVVSNAGPSNADGAIFKDSAVANLTITGVTCGSAAGGAACPTVPNTTIALMQGSGIVVPTLPSGGAVTFTVNATVSSGASGSISNVATVTAPAGVTDPTPGNNTATDTDTITLSADLAITKDDGSATYVPGGTTTYTIVVSNNGPSNVTGATIADNLPAAITSDTWTATATGGATGFTAAGAGNINDTVTMPAGSTIMYTVLANIDASATGNLANTATVAVPVGATDPTPANNTATDTDTPAPQVTLVVAKTDGSLTYTPGGTAIYTVTVTDTGVSDAQNVTVTDLLPASLTLTANVSCTANGSANCAAFFGSVGGTSFGTSGATIPAGAGNSLVFTAPVAFASGMTAPSLSNTATATDLTSGATASNTDTDTLAPQVTLAVAKTDGSTSYTPGGSATYTVTITHGGLSDATNITVNDPLPAGVTLTSNASCVATGTANCGVLTGTTGQSVFGTTGASIAAGPGNSLVFTAPVAFAPGLATNPLDNTATAVDALSGANGAATDSDTRAAQVTLAVTKTDNSATYTPGGSATYLVGVANTGVSDALNVTVNDILPVGVVLTANATCVPSGIATCGTVTGTTGQATFGTTGAQIAAGAGNFLTFTIPVAFASSLIDNPLTNTATAQDLSSGATGSATDNDTLAAQADLAITKTDGVGNVTPGGTTTYTIVVTNNGPGDVTGATVADILPAAITSDTFTAVGAGGASGFTASGSGNIGDIVNLPVGSTITYTILATISGSASGTLANTATVAPPAGVIDPIPGNNSATDTDTLAAQADLAITKTDGVVNVVPGTTTTYTIVVTNNGPSDIIGATVSDVLPAAIVSDTWTATASGGATGFTAAGAGNINDTVNMPAGSTITYTVLANIGATATGTLSNTATVTVPAGVTDTNPGNNSATDTDTLTPQADLAITKTDGVVNVSAPGTTTYTIVVTNNGPSNVTAATVSDTLPPAILSAAYTATSTGGASGFTAVGSGNINDTVDMPAGSTITYTVVANISGSASGTLVNTAVVTAPAGVTDTNPGNNSATDTDTITVIPMADLGITKSDGSATYTPGNPITYTIVVSNAGPVGVTGATVADVVPAAITGANWTCAGIGGGTCPASGSGNINASVNLPVGASVTFTLTGTVTPTASGNLVNTATVTPPAGIVDPNPGNNTATDTDTPSIVAGLVIAKTDGSATYTPGGNGVYTITVTNNGPSNANSVTVTDNLPAGVTLSANATCVASGTATCGTVTGASGGTTLTATGATIAAGAGNRLVFTVPVHFASNLITSPLVNIATATDPASASVASASDSNTLAQAPTTPIPVDSRWALSLLAGFILLAAWRRSREAPLRRRT